MMRRSLDFSKINASALPATRALAKVFGRDSDGWRGREVELSLGHYKKKDSDETKETVVATPIGATQEQNGGATPQPPRRGDMDDEIQF